MKFSKEELTQKVKVKLGLAHEIFEHNGWNINAGGVYRVIQIGNSKPYVALSASRDGFTAKENSERNKNLLEKIKALNLHAYKMLGLYKECPKDNPECEEKDKTPVEEESFFVPHNPKMSLTEFAESMHKLGNEFGQDSILLGLPKQYKYEKESITVGKTEIPVGFHYYLYKSGTLKNIGTKIETQTMVDYGSRALDPKKKRKLDWKVTGTLQPGSVGGMMSYSSLGLLFVEGVHHENSTWYSSVEDYVHRTPNAVKFIEKI